MKFSNNISENKQLDKHLRRDAQLSDDIHDNNPISSTPDDAEPAAAWNTMDLILK
jgi:hypothetical protein